MVMIVMMVMMFHNYSLFIGCKDENYIVWHNSPLMMKNNGCGHK